MKAMIKYGKNISFTGLVLINSVIASDGSLHNTDGDKSLANPLKYGELEEILDAIAGFLFRISIPLLVIMIIIGAFYLVTAGGSEEKVTRGKKTITWAIIGFVIILLAGSIASLIRNFLE